MCGVRIGNHSEKYRKEKNEKTRQPTGLEKFIGDGLTLKMESNERDIEVTGDGCRLTMANNRGKIRINGDGCRLRIGRNSGAIEYRGDGGRVSLGPDSTGTKVHYFGEGGRVNIAGSARAKNSPPASGEAGTKKNEPRARDDLAERTVTDDDNSSDKRPRRILRTTSKTVRIVYGNPKIVPPTKNSHSIKISKSCTVSG